MSDFNLKEEKTYTGAEVRKILETAEIKSFSQNGRSIDVSAEEVSEVIEDSDLFIYREDWMSGDSFSPAVLSKWFGLVDDQGNFIQDHRVDFGIK